ncbi:MAG: cupin domain-containing protein [Chitinophagaceae bacterium]
MIQNTTKDFTDNPFVENAEVHWEVLSEKVKRKILVYDRQVMLVCVVFQKGGIGELHSHPHTQMSYIEQGVFEVEIDGKKKTLQKGDAFYVPSNSVHGVRCLEDGVLMDVFNPMREDFIS